jgi:hypothetical protein
VDSINDAALMSLLHSINAEMYSPRSSTTVNMELVMLLLLLLLLFHCLQPIDAGVS